MRNILVPINFGSNSALAIDFAAKIADKLDTRIDLAHTPNTKVCDVEMEEYQHHINLLVKNEPRNHPVIKPVFRAQS